MLPIADRALGDLKIFRLLPAAFTHDLGDRNAHDRSEDRPGPFPGGNILSAR